MSEQVQRQQSTSLGQTGGSASDHTQTSSQNRNSSTDSGLDALLDSIDAVLETNAEEYVRSFVQKGGQ